MPFVKIAELTSSWTPTKRLYLTQLIENDPEPHQLRLFRSSCHKDQEINIPLKGNNVDPSFLARLRRWLTPETGRLGKIPTSLLLLREVTWSAAAEQTFDLAIVLLTLIVVFANLAVAIGFYEDATAPATHAAAGNESGNFNTSNGFANQTVPETVTAEAAKTSMLRYSGLMIVYGSFSGLVIAAAFASLLKERFFPTAPWPVALLFVACVPFSNVLPAISYILRFDEVVARRFLSERARASEVAAWFSRHALTILLQVMNSLPQSLFLIAYISSGHRRPTPTQWLAIVLQGVTLVLRFIPPLARLFPGRHAVLLVAIVAASLFDISSVVYIAGTLLQPTLGGSRLVTWLGVDLSFAGITWFLTIFCFLLLLTILVALSLGLKVTRDLAEHWIVLLGPLAVVTLPVLLLPIVYTVKATPLCLWLALRYLGYYDGKNVERAKLQSGGGGGAGADAKGSKINKPAKKEQTMFRPTDPDAVDNSAALAATATTTTTTATAAGPDAHVDGGHRGGSQFQPSDSGLVQDGEEAAQTAYAPRRGSDEAENDGSDGIDDDGDDDNNGANETGALPDAGNEDGDGARLSVAQSRALFDPDAVQLFLASGAHTSLRHQRQVLERTLERRAKERAAAAAASASASASGSSGLARGASAGASPPSSGGIHNNNNGGGIAPVGATNGQAGRLLAPPERGSGTSGSSASNSSPSYGATAGAGGSAAALSGGASTPGAVVTVVATAGGGQKKHDAYDDTVNFAEQETAAESAAQRYFDNVARFCVGAFAALHVANVAALAAHFLLFAHDDREDTVVQEVSFWFAVVGIVACAVCWAVAVAMHTCECCGGADHAAAQSQLRAQIRNPGVRAAGSMHGVELTFSNLHSHNDRGDDDHGASSSSASTGYQRIDDKKQSSSGGSKSTSGGRHGAMAAGPATSPRNAGKANGQRQPLLGAAANGGGARYTAAAPTATAAAAAAATTAAGAAEADDPAAGFEAVAEEEEMNAVIDTAERIRPRGYVTMSRTSLPFTRTFTATRVRNGTHHTTISAVMTAPCTEVGRAMLNVNLRSFRADFYIADFAEDDMCIGLVDPRASGTDRLMPLWRMERSIALVFRERSALPAVFVNGAPLQVLPLKIGDDAAAAAEETSHFARASSLGGSSPTHSSNDIFSKHAAAAAAAVAAAATAASQPGDPNRITAVAVGVFCGHVFFELGNTATGMHRLEVPALLHDTIVTGMWRLAVSLPKKGQRIILKRIETIATRDAPSTAAAAAAARREERQKQAASSAPAAASSTSVAPSVTVEGAAQGITPSGLQPLKKRRTPAPSADAAPAKDAPSRPRRSESPGPKLLLADDDPTAPPAGSAGGSPQREFDDDGDDDNTDGASSASDTNRDDDDDDDDSLGGYMGDRTVTYNAQRDGWSPSANDANQQRQQRRRQRGERSNGKKKQEARGGDDVLATDFPMQAGAMSAEQQQRSRLFEAEERAKEEAVARLSGAVVGAPSTGHRGSAAAAAAAPPTGADTQLKNRRGGAPSTDKPEAPETLTARLMEAARLVHSDSVSDDAKPYDNGKGGASKSGGNGNSNGGRGGDVVAAAHHHMSSAFFERKLRALASLLKRERDEDATVGQEVSYAAQELGTLGAFIYSAAMISLVFLLLVIFLYSGAATNFVTILYDVHDPLHHRDGDGKQALQRAVQSGSYVEWRTLVSYDWSGECNRSEDYNATQLVRAFEQAAAAVNDNTYDDDPGNSSLSPLGLGGRAIVHCLARWVREDVNHSALVCSTVVQHAWDASMCLAAARIPPCLVSYLLAYFCQAREGLRRCPVDATEESSPLLCADRKYWLLSEPRLPFLASFQATRPQLTTGITSQLVVVNSSSPFVHLKGSNCYVNLGIESLLFTPYTLLIVSPLLEIAFLSFTQLLFVPLVYAILHAATSAVRDLRRWLSSCACCRANSDQGSGSGGENAHLLAAAPAVPNHGAIIVPAAQQQEAATPSASSREGQHPCGHCGGSSCWCSCCTTCTRWNDDADRSAFVYERMFNQALFEQLATLGPRAIGCEFYHATQLLRLPEIFGAIRFAPPPRAHRYRIASLRRIAVPTKSGGAEWKIAEFVLQKFTWGNDVKTASGEACYELCKLRNPSVITQLLDTPLPLAFGRAAWILANVGLLIYSTVQVWQRRGTEGDAPSDRISNTLNYLSAACVNSTLFTSLLFCVLPLTPETGFSIFFLAPLCGSINECPPDADSGKPCDTCTVKRSNAALDPRALSRDEFFALADRAYHFQLRPVQLVPLWICRGVFCMVLAVISVHVVLGSALYPLTVLAVSCAALLIARILARSFVTKQMAVLVLLFLLRVVLTIVLTVAYQSAANYFALTVHNILDRDLPQARLQQEVQIETSAALGVAAPQRAPYWLVIEREYTSRSLACYINHIKTGLVSVAHAVGINNLYSFLFS